MGAKNPDEIYFTSCGSESANMAIKGVVNCNKDKRHIITTKIEHPCVLNTYKELEKQGSLKPGARLIANHFSHNPNLTHEELCTWLNPLGIEVGYDGMEIEL
jgi:selenocysteine lyase/cysteine desulfurase